MPARPINSRDLARMWLDKLEVAPSMRKQESWGLSEPAHPGEPPPAMWAASLVVLGAGALLFSCFGTAYAVPVFFPALSQALAVPLPHLTALFSATGTLYFVLGVASGPLADRIGARIVAAVGCAMLACGLIVMSRAGSECVFGSPCAVLMAVTLTLSLAIGNDWELSGDAALYGLGYGGVIGLTGPIVVEVLGVRGICASVGVVTTPRALGIQVGPWAVGVTAHRLGSYDFPFLACASLALVAALLLGRFARRMTSQSPHQVAPAAAFPRDGAGTGGHHQ